jgi:hypothetical protein
MPPFFRVNKLVQTKKKKKKNRAHDLENQDAMSYFLG